MTTALGWNFELSMVRIWGRLQGLRLPSVKFQEVGMGAQRSGKPGPARQTSWLPPGN